MRPLLAMFTPEVSPPHAPEFDLRPGLDHRPVGRHRSTFPRRSPRSPAREQLASALAPRFASYATMLLGVGTIVGCLLLPPIAERIGRSAMARSLFLCMLRRIAFGFGPAFYLKQDAMNGSSSSCFFWESAAPISRCTRCGCPSNIQRSFAAAPSHSIRRLAASSAPASPSW